MAKKTARKPQASKRARDLKKQRELKHFISLLKERKG